MDTLVLDATWQPIARVSWQRAMTLLVGGRAEMVEEYEDRAIRTVSVVFQMPSIVRHVSGTRRRTPRVMRFSRHNVFVRDQGRCQYCRKQVPRHEATFDHVVPRVQGGPTNWTNIVLACFRCNHRKGGRTPEQASMPLWHVPKAPSWLPETFKLTLTREKNVPESWQAYLPQLQYWYSALKQD